MGERKQFKIKSSRVVGRAGKRELFKIAVTVRPQKHGTDAAVNQGRRAFDDAEKILESLVRSGRLVRKK